MRDDYALRQDKVALTVKANGENRRPQGWQDDFPSALRSAIADFGLDPVKEDESSRLAAHFKMLSDWNRKSNLTRITNVREAARLHYAESIFAAQFVRGIEECAHPRGPFVQGLLGGREFLEPRKVLRTHLRPGWAESATILLVMQWEDHALQLEHGRSLFTGFRKDLVSAPMETHAPPPGDLGHGVVRAFAKAPNGLPMTSVNEGLLGVPLTAHILGGVPFGIDEKEGVVGPDCQVHGYPGIYVVDGSILPGNPGVNPSLTITAMAEYAMSLVPPAPNR